MYGDSKSHGLWERSAPEGPPTPPLTGDVVADVAIIGAGFTGCSAALHLAEGGCRPVVLDAAQVGFGGSGRNVGLVNAGLWVLPDEVPKILGDHYGERLLTQLGQAPALVFDLIAKHEIACEPQRAGTLHCAVGRSGFQQVSQRAAQWRRRGVDVTLLDRDETARRVGSKAYSGSLLDSRAGTVQPLAYVRGLARAAIVAGAAIHADSPVLGMDDLGTAWRLRTTHGSVTARWLIVATDAYSSGVWSALRTEQVMLPYFNLATRPLSADVRRTILPGLEGAWDTRTILSSFRLDKDGRLIFGSVGALRGTGTPIHRAWAVRELARLFPQLGKVAFEHEWYGQIGMTKDAAPRFHIHDRNIVSISGYNGRGIAPGTSFGRDLAQLAMGRVEPTDLSLPVTATREAHLRTAKGLVYEFGSQAAHAVGARL